MQICKKQFSEALYWSRSVELRRGEGFKDQDNSGIDQQVLEGADDNSQLQEEGKAVSQSTCWCDFGGCWKN